MSIFQVGDKVSIDRKLAGQIRDDGQWPAGLPLNTRLEISQVIPGPQPIPGHYPSDPIMQNYVVKFPNGNTHQFTAMFLCDEQPPFVNCPNPNPPIHFQHWHLT